MKSQRLMIFVLLFFLPILFPERSYAQESIDNFSVKIVIKKNATVLVNEIIDYDFGQDQRRGIIREIPIIYSNDEGKKFKIDLSVDNVTNESGVLYKYRVSEENGRKIIKIGEENKYLTGEHTYNINYQTKGVITYFRDHDEFYWNVTGNEWSVPIEKASLELNLDFNADEINIVCYTGEFSKDCDTKKVNQSQILVNSMGELGPGSGLSVVLGFPKNIVEVVEPSEVIDFWETPFGKLVAVILAVIAFLYYIVSPFIVFVIWYKYGRDPSVSKPVTAWFDPPKDSHGKTLHPAQVGTLVDEHADDKDISATIVDLAIRGFLKIREIKKSKDYEFIKIQKDYKNEELTDYEKNLLDEFFTHRDKISTSQLKDSFYKTTTKIKNGLYEELVIKGFFPKNPDKVRTVFYVISFVVLITGNFLLAASLFIFGRVMPKKTIYGAISQKVSLGLKNFLTSYERQLKFQTEKWYLFEKLLPYAIVFGVEDLWAKRFEHLNPKPPDWYDGTYSGAYNSTVFTRSLTQATSNFAGISSSPSSKSSSGFSSGFSGGGGGFGGGGGSSW